MDGHVGLFQPAEKSLPKVRQFSFFNSIKRLTSLLRRLFFVFKFYEKSDFTESIVHTLAVVGNTMG